MKFSSFLIIILINVLVSQMNVFKPIFKRECTVKIIKSIEANKTKTVLLVHQFELSYIRHDVPLIPFFSFSVFSENGGILFPSLQKCH